MGVQPQLLEKTPGGRTAARFCFHNTTRLFITTSYKVVYGENRPLIYKDNLETTELW